MDHNIINKDMVNKIGSSTLLIELRVTINMALESLLQVNLTKKMEKTSTHKDLDNLCERPSFQCKAKVCYKSSV